MSNVIDPIKPSVQNVGDSPESERFDRTAGGVGRVGNVIEKLTLGPR